MPAFSTYSFEELRLAYQLSFTHKETLKLNLNDEQSYAAIWIPKKPGKYRIECRIDGFKVKNPTLVEVFERDTPLKPPETPKKAAPLTPRHSRAMCEAVSTYKGVRIRAHPTLGAQQIGIVPRGATISYMEQMRNLDGVWLKLSDEARMLYCDSKLANQGWCLQYNEHLETEYLKVRFRACVQAISSSFPPPPNPLMEFFAARPRLRP